MTSYLFYILACIREWPGLHQEPWVDGMKVYECYPHLQIQRYTENFLRWNVFVGRLTFELQGDLNNRMSPGALKLVTTYGSCFIQFPRFTYIRIGGFEDEPFRLPKYALDSYVLLEVSRHLAHVDKRFGMKSESEAIFPVELGHYSCQTVSDALNLELELKKMNLPPYVAWQGFNNKEYAVKHLNVDVNFSHIL